MKFCKFLCSFCLLIIFSVSMVGCSNGTTNEAVNTNSNINNFVKLDWTDVTSITHYTDINSSYEYNSTIESILNDEQITAEQYESEYSEENNAPISTNSVLLSNYNSLEEAINAFESKIDKKKYYTRSTTQSEIYQYRKATCVGYRYTVYKVKEYFNNVLDIKVIQYNSTSDTTSVSSYTVYGSYYNIKYFKSTNI